MLIYVPLCRYWHADIKWAEELAFCSKMKSVACWSSWIGYCSIWHLLKSYFFNTSPKDETYLKKNTWSEASTHGNFCDFFFLNSQDSPLAFPCLGMPAHLNSFCASWLWHFSSSNRERQKKAAGLQFILKMSWLQFKWASWLLVFLTKFYTGRCRFWSSPLDPQKIQIMK